MVVEMAPTDPHSTQTVSYIPLILVRVILNSFQGELEHHQVKQLHGQMNKQKAIKQITPHECHEMQLLHAWWAATMKDKCEYNSPAPCSI